jgi:hypothetical protein
MPVHRYRDVADMPSPPRCDPKTPGTFARIRELWRWSSRLPPLFAPGCYRYRSVDASHQAREAAAVDRMRRVRNERDRTKR